MFGCCPNNSLNDAILLLYQTIFFSGLSKHVNMTIISYSAEGATFMDRDAYPYFFRTIGENRQYDARFVIIFHFVCVCVFFVGMNKCTFNCYNK